MRNRGWRWLWLLPALALLWLGSARLIEGWRIWPLVQYVHAAWWQGAAPAAPADLLATAPGRPDGRMWSAYGQVVLAAASGTADAEERRRLLERADRATRKALSLSPAQAATWARLSLIALNRGDRTTAVRALRRSLALAPNATNLVWPRAKLGLYLWAELDREGRAGVARDVRRLSRQAASAALPYPRQALERYAQAIGRQELVIRLARGGDGREG